MTPTAPGWYITEIVPDSTPCVLHWNGTEWDDPPEPPTRWFGPFLGRLGAQSWLDANGPLSWPNQ